MSFLESSHIETSLKIIERWHVCDYCLGRQFAWLGTGTTNRERGRSIKLALLMIADEELKKGDSEKGRELVTLLSSKGMFAPARLLAQESGLDVPEEGNCVLCSVQGASVFDKVPSIAEDILRAAQGIEFDTFLVGSVPPAVLVDKQDELGAEHSLMHSETLKSHFNRELGKAAQPLLQRTVDFERPDVVFVYDMEKQRLSLQVNPVFIYGRYRKLKRGIPQSRWDCSACRGRGCKECNGTGRRYPDSISEYIGEPTQRLLEGSRFKVHAAGREDVDVLMLGEGRPFVVEISEPRIRKPDLEKIRKAVNRHARRKVEIGELALVTRGHLQRLKSEASVNIKEYMALIEVGREVTDADIGTLEREFTGIEIEQRTPHRVAHRRSDLLRKKRVYHVRAKKRKKNIIEASLRVQGGTYVKELISGDEGRTKPSVSEKLETPCKCIQLDVTAIYASKE